MSCARPRGPQAQPHRSSAFHHLPCCLSSSFSGQYGVQRNRGQLKFSRDRSSAALRISLEDEGLFELDPVAIPGVLPLLGGGGAMLTDTQWGRLEPLVE